MGVVPNRMGIAVVGLVFDKHGNSTGGTKILEELSKKY
ncbi:MAG: glutaminase [Clostridiaceae bacterium]